MRRQASKSSGYRWCWDCDPSVSAEDKALARQLGGRRGAMTLSEITRLFDGADLGDHAGRQTLRDRFVRLYLAGRLGEGRYRALLATLDSAAKDHERNPKAKAPEGFVIVEPFERVPSEPGA